MPDVECKVAELGEKFRIGFRNRERGGAADAPFDGGIIRGIAAALGDRDVQDLPAGQHADAHLHFGVARNGVGHVRLPPDLVLDVVDELVDLRLLRGRGLRPRFLGLGLRDLLVLAALVFLALLLVEILLLALLLRLVVPLLLRLLVLDPFLLLLVALLALELLRDRRVGPGRVGLFLDPYGVTEDSSDVWKLFEAAVDWSVASESKR